MQVRTYTGLFVLLVYFSKIIGTFHINFIGFLLKHEAEILSQYEEEEQTTNSKWSLRVINWAMMLVREGRDRDYFENPSDASRLLDPIIAFKKSCSVVLKYQITAIPLSFVQVRKCTTEMKKMCVRMFAHI